MFVQAVFGRGQIIMKIPQTSGDRFLLWGGSDPRSDGCAIPAACDSDPGPSSHLDSDIN